MKVRFNDVAVFAMTYPALLLVGISFGLLLANATGVNAGLLIAVLCFCAATVVALADPGERLATLFSISPKSCRSLTADQRLLLPVVFAAIGVATDAAIHAAGALYFTGAIVPVAPGRLVVVGLAYAGLAWFTMQEMFSRSGSPADV